MIIFDLDGTLINSIGDITNSVNYALEKLGYPTHRQEDCINYVGNGITKLIERALPLEERSEAKIIKVRDIFVEHYSAHNTVFSKPYPAIPELLEEIQAKGIKIAIASNKYESATVKIANHFFPQIKFAAIHGQREGVPTKPDPTIIHNIMSKVGITDHSQILYVGDSGTDMQTAANASLDACAVTWGYRSKKRLEEFSPKYIVDDIDELREVVLGIKTISKSVPL